MKKIFTTHVKKVISLVMIFMLLLSTQAFSYNYTVDETEELIDKISLKRGVPSVLVKSIAYLESGLQQFNSNGTAKVSRGNNIGLMQVNNNSNTYNSNKLMYDIEYNINAGIDVLLQKWNASATSSVSKVGYMNPNVLENWYFALWAYNGWLGRNNPNYNSNTYQDRVLNVCKQRYGTTINEINTSKLPSYGVPSRGLVVETPANTTSSSIYNYKKDDLVVVRSVTGYRNLYYQPLGAVQSTVSDGQMAKIVDGPVLKSGTYYFKLLINNKTTGWIERNWLEKVGDSKNGVYPYTDVAYHWSAESVANMYNKGVLTKKTDNLFKPDENLTKQEFFIMLAKLMDLDVYSYQNQKLSYKDSSSIDSWAVLYIKALKAEGMLDGYGDMLYPKAGITRGEVISILSKYITNIEKIKYEEKYKQTFNEKTYFKLSTVKLPFTDISKLQDFQKDNIKILYSKGIISGKSATQLGYSDIVSRASVVSSLNKVYNLYNK